LVTTFTKIPQIVAAIARKFVRTTVMKKAKFDISALNPIDSADKCFSPVLFVVAKNDDFVRPYHTDLLHKKYAGEKNFILVEGDHNSDRPQFFMDSASIFFYNTLGLDILP